jgi:hypothetical protein
MQSSVAPSGATFLSKMNSLLRSQYNKLRHHLIYLKLEKDDILSLLEHYHCQFNAAVFKYCSDNNLPSPLKEVETKSVQQSSSFSEEDNKKMYREIVQKCHPDKLKNSNEGNAKKMAEIYQNATEAKSHNSFGDLFYSYIELGIEPDILSEDFLAKMHNEASNLSLKIKSLKSNPVYYWGKCSDSKKNKIIKNFF